MFGLRGIVLVALGAFGAFFSAAWVRNLLRLRDQPPKEPDGQVRAPSPVHLGIGFVTNFFDTLGIGSFAPTTALFRFLRLVPDQLIPGTLLIGHTAATLTEAFIFIAIIEVEMITLIALIAAAVLGSWRGAGIVSRLPKRQIQLGMGVALMGAAVLMLLGILKVVPAGGEALGLTGARLFIGIAGSFVIGALMTIGIGNFAPSLILYGFLGMNTRSIFPIMMGSCAFLMTVGSLQFMRRASYSPRAALGLLAGVPAVLIAAYLVKELPLYVLRWLVLAVVVYTAASMLKTAIKTENGAAQAPPEAR
jgi:uncharacterized membrane protein YfcA